AHYMNNDNTPGAARGATVRAAPTVLLVEDSADDAELALHSLNRCNLGAEVHWVRDGAEALAWIDANGGQALRLVLLDLRMPHMDGFEVLRRLRADPVTRTVPVLVMVSDHAAPDVERCSALGADGYLVKPLEPEPLHAALGRLDIRLE